MVLLSEAVVQRTRWGSAVAGPPHHDPPPPIHIAGFQDLTGMEPIRNLFASRATEHAYAPVDADGRDDDGSESAGASEDTQGLVEDKPFSWIEYTIFLILGIAMLWAW